MYVRSIKTWYLFFVHLVLSLSMWILRIFMVYSYHIRENDKSSFQRIKSLSMLLVMIYCETQNGLKLRISRVFVTDDVGLLNYQRIHLSTYINIREVLYEHRRSVHKNSRSFFKLANCSIHLFATRSCEWITNAHQRPKRGKNDKVVLRALFTILVITRLVKNQCISLNTV